MHKAALTSVRASFILLVMQNQQAYAQYAKSSAHGLWVCDSSVVDSEAIRMLR